MKLLSRSGLLFGFLFGLVLAMPRARAETIASRTIDVDGLKMHYFAAGSAADTLILIHGYAQSAHMWEAAMPELSQRFTVIASPADRPVTRPPLLREEIPCPPLLPGPARCCSTAPITR